MSKFLSIEQKSLLGKKLPTVHVRNIILSKGQVSLNLLIKEKIVRSNPASTWSNNPPLLENMKIKVILSFDQGLTKSIFTENATHWKNFNTESSLEKILHSSNFIRFSEAIPYQDSSLFSIKDSNKNIIHEMFSSVSFLDKRVGERNPVHLACFVFPYLTDERNLSSGYSGLVPFSLKGKVTSDIIFDEGKIKDNAMALYTLENEIWTGDVHKMSNGRLMEGLRHSSGSRYLKEKKVPNTKIQDLRVVDKIKSSLSYNKTSRFEKNLSQFSDLYSTRDREGNVRFSFGMDCREIYKNNAKFSEFFENSYFTNDIMSVMKISSIQVFRQRVDRGGEKGMDIEEPKLIVVSQDSSPRNLAKAQHSENDSLVGSIQETKIALKGASQSERFRHFSITDYNISNAADSNGAYQYRVEIEIHDGTSDFAENKVRQLALSLKELKQYYSDSKIRMNRSSDRFKQGFLDRNRGKKSRILKTSIRLYIENLILFSNLIDTESQKNLSRTLISMTHPASGNSDGILFFINLIEEIVSKNIERLAEKGFLSEDQQLHVHKGGVKQSIANKNTFIVIKEFSDAAEIFHANTPKNVGANYLGESLLGAGLVRITKPQWEQRVAQETKNYFNAEAASQQLKGNKGTYSFGTVRNMNRYLSPVEVEIGDNSLELANVQNSNEFLGFDIISSQRLQHSKTNGGALFSEKSIDSEEAILNEVTNFFNENSISLLSSAEVKEQSSTNKKFQVSTSPVVTAYIGEDSLFETSEKSQIKFEDKGNVKGTFQNKDMTRSLAMMMQIMPKQVQNEQGTNNEERTISKIHSPVSQINEIYDLESEGNMIDLLSKRELAAVPNQLFSLAIPGTVTTLESKSPEKVNINFSNNSEFSIKFNMLQEVEILTGYGSAGIKDPIWTPLGSRAINNVVLARLKPYTNPDLGIERKENLDLPVYNEYFYLGNKFLTNGNEMKKSASFAIRDTYIYPELLNTSIDFLNSATGVKKQFRKKGANILDTATSTQETTRAQRLIARTTTQGTTAPRRMTSTRTRRVERMSGRQTPAGRTGGGTGY